MKDHRNLWPLVLSVVVGCGIAVTVWMAGAAGGTQVPDGPPSIEVDAPKRGEANPVDATTIAAASARKRVSTAPELASDTEESASTGLVVRVFYEDRQPVSGIGISWIVDSDLRPQHGATNGQGVLLADYPLGRSFRVTVAGQTTAATSRDGPARVDFVVGRHRRIQVCVSAADGTRVSGASVLLGSKGNAQVAIPVAETGPQGLATFSSFDRRDLVWVSKEGWRSTARLPVTAASRQNASQSDSRTWLLEFLVERMQSSDLVHGRVVNVAGRPIPDVTVRWLAGAGGPRLRYRSFLAEHPAPVTVQSDAAGRFSLPLCGGRGRLHARCRGFADVWQDLDPLSYEVDGVEVVLPPEATIEGFVVGQAGLPVGGAQVEARVGDDDPVASITDASGRFRLRGVRGSQDHVDTAGTVVELCAFHASEGSAREEFALANVGFADIRLALVGELLTGLLRRDAEPVSRAQVYVRGTIRSWRGGSWDYRGYSVTTLEDGRFRLVRPVGRWSLIVEPESERSLIRAPLRFPGAGLSNFVDIDLNATEQARGTIRVSASYADKRPLDSYWLRLFPRKSKSGAISVFCAQTDGKLEASVPAGNYRVAISPRGGSLMQEVDDASVLTGAVCNLGNVTIEPPTTLSGSLTPDSFGGVEDLVGTITLRARSPAVSLWSGGFGRWEIPYVAPGHYTLAPGRRSQIDFDPVEVDVVAGENPSIRLLGRPCWRGRVYLRLPSGAFGLWVAEFSNCRGLPERRTFDAGSAQNGRISLSEVLLPLGASRFLIGPVDGLLRSFTVAPEHTFIRVDLR